MSSSGAPDWLGLLQWSLAHQDGTAPSNQEVMSAENQAWLEQVLREGVVDEPKKIAELLVGVKKHLDGDSLSEEDIDALHEMADISEQIDMAEVFVKLGGFRLMHDIVASGIEESKSSLSEEIIVAALALTGTVSQNNPAVQREALVCPEGVSSSLLDAIATLVQRSSRVSARNVQIKGLFALSCIVRGHELGEQVFTARHCHALFTDILKGDVERDGHYDKVLAKIFFLSKALLSSDYVTLERLRLISEVVLPHCPGGVRSPDLNLRDCSIGLLHELLETIEGRSAVMVHLNKFHDAVIESICLLKDRRTNATSDDEKMYINEDLNLFNTLSSRLEPLGTGELGGPAKHISPDSDEKDEVRLLLAPQVL